MAFASIEDGTGNFNDLEADLSDLEPGNDDLNPGFNNLVSEVQLQSDVKECKPPGTGCIFQVCHQNKLYYTTTTRLIIEGTEYVTDRIVLS